MRPPHDTRSAALAALVLAGLTAGCQLPLVESGRAPEGDVREHETEETRAIEARRAEMRHARLDEEEAAVVPAVSASEDGDPRRHGSVKTRMFHRADCSELASVPAQDRVTFESNWGAIDANLSPCPKCRPGP